MLTQREKMLMIITFCLTFCFAIIMLTYSITEFLIIFIMVKHS